MNWKIEDMVENKKFDPFEILRRARYEVCGENFEAYVILLHAEDHLYDAKKQQPAEVRE